MRCVTKFKKSAIEAGEATYLYNFLKDNIIWGEGVRSKKTFSHENPTGFTRKACPLRFGDVEEVDVAIVKALSQLTDKSYTIRFIYLNYYEDGKMWCPNHTHSGTHQLVISLGCDRILQVNKKDYVMSNGDAIIFGSALHGVPPDNSKSGRISIATFMEFE